LLANKYFGPAVKKRWVRAKEADASYTNAIIRSISGIFVVQSYGREEHEAENFNDAAMLTANRWQNAQIAQAAYDFVVHMVFTGSWAFVFGYGAYLVYCDQFWHPVANGFTVGDLMVFLTYLGSLWDPLSKLTGATVNLKPGIAGAE